MKAVLSILGSVWFVGSTFVPMIAPAGGKGPAVNAACCCDCGTAACCAAKPSTEPLPESAAPAPSGSQNQLLAAPTGLLAWTLPAAGADESVISFQKSPIAAEAPLYARLCARLI